VEQATKLSIDSQVALRRIRVHWLAHKVHEMRGPLFAVRGYTKLLIEEKGGEVTVTQRRYLTTILENINKLGGCADSLQEFSAQEELSLELLDFAELLRVAVADWREREQTLRLNDQILTGPALTTGDRSKLSLAVHKLLGAMVEFSRSGGKIELHAKREEDEFLMRLAASANEPCEPACLSDLTGPCEVLRLHGGVASVDCTHAGLFHITVRLPLIWLETGDSRNVSPA
jgi:signal transduction histidine kinase